MKYIVHPNNKQVIKGSTVKVNDKRKIFAADEEDDDLFGPGMDDIVDDDDFNDTLDDVADTVDDIQDAVEEVEEDEVDIEIDNNISNHYIAECETCHGVFISAMLKSDQIVEKISGVCPLCEKESSQYLRWVIVDAKADTEE